MGNTVCGAQAIAEGHKLCDWVAGPPNSEIKLGDPSSSSEREAQGDEDVKDVGQEVPIEDSVVEEPISPAPPPSTPGGQTDEHLQSEVNRLRSEKQEEYKTALGQSRKHMREDTFYGAHRPANRYGTHAELPVFESGKHVPVLGLLNPMAGAMAGVDIMQIMRRTPYYQDRFFNIIDVVKGGRRGGLMDVFRIELQKAKDEAKAVGTRPRLVSGGGDGTGSFAVFILFLALKADNERAEDGLADTGNGFIWTDQEMKESFPALVQMPLGSANDFGNILGWGQKYPGDGCKVCASRDGAAARLSRWIDAAIDPKSPLANFDIWGLMPAKGEEKCNFKIAELTGKRGSTPNEPVNGVRQLQLKEAGKPVPFFVMLYFSTGFGAYMTARFQINRRSTPIKNRAEYCRQALGIMTEPPPPQTYLRLNNVEVDCETQPYFPPRRDAGVQGRGYREVGFYNINWQAHLLHGASRASLKERIMSKREPVKFNDGFMDMYRWKFMSILKNPGIRVQTDKKKDLQMTFKGDKGKGLFFQWDGEARFAFSPTGEAFNIYIRKVVNMPVVLGPFLNERLTGPIDNGSEVAFSWGGETPEDQDIARRRVLQNVGGELDKELIASKEEILAADLRVWEASSEEKGEG